MKEVMLDVENLSIYYDSRRGVKKAVHQVSFQVFKDEIFGLVGESGSGKSTLCYGLLNLLPPTGRIVSGRVKFMDADLLALQGEQLRQMRWRDLSFIPQGAMSALNPVLRIGAQISDVIRDHEGPHPAMEPDQRTREILESVGLPPSVARRYPHELSGGMKQRVCIALAVVLKPSLILADEPSSSLDVVSQRVVIEMLAGVREKMQASMILVGHDMALQAQVADRLGIMYAGQVVEIGSVRDIFDDPAHPYTQRLIASIPSIRKKQDIHHLATISFDEAEKARVAQDIRLVEAKPGHWVAQPTG